MDIYEQMVFDAGSYKLSVSAKTIKNHLTKHKIDLNELETYPTLRRLLAITIAGGGFQVVHEMFKLLEEHRPTPTANSPEELKWRNTWFRALKVYDIDKEVL